MLGMCQRARIANCRARSTALSQIIILVELYYATFELQLEAGMLREANKIR